MALPAQAVTNFPLPISTTCALQLGDATGYAIIATCDGVPPTSANFFQVGCLMVRTDVSTLYTNTGTVAIPVWTANA